MKVFAPYGPFQGPDFLLKYKFDFTNDVDAVLSEPYKLSFLPAPELQLPSGIVPQVTMPEQEKLKQMDLVFFSYTENGSHLMEPWFANLPYSNKLFARGYVNDSADTVFYPWWFFYIQNVHPEHFINEPEIKPYKFDAILGCKRLPREYIFQELIKHDLIKSSIVTYRSAHPERDRDYLCPHFQPEWDQNYLSPVGYTIFDKIYNLTDFTILSETFWNRSQKIFFSEKTGRVLKGKRLFVYFGVRHSLQALRDLGFETFSDIIDESYDNIYDDTQRFAAAFEQVLALHQMDSVLIKKKIQDRLQHNHDRVYSLQAELNQNVCDKIAAKLGDKDFWSKIPLA